MTATTNAPSSSVTDLVTCTIDGTEVSVPKGTLIIRAAEQVGIQIPRFCDHPLLKPAGACRQCLVDVAMPDREGNVRAMPKPQASCTMEVTPGMVVNTQQTSEVADKAQKGVMEFLLINHPLDCPVCDKGGECPLQNQALSNGRATSRFHEIKRTYPKPIKISTQILLDRDRCILCQRCTRFSAEIAGDPFIDLQGRGGGTPGRDIHGQPAQQVGAFDPSVLGVAVEGHAPHPVHVEIAGPDGVGGIASGVAGTVGNAELDTTGRPFASYFSGNTIQICPVGALTSASYRFRARPFDLVSVESIAEHDASGSAIRIDHRRGVVVRRLAGDDPAVNEEWITDKDRFAYHWQTGDDVLTTPLVRDENTGELVAASWSEALQLAHQGLMRAVESSGVGYLPGGRLTIEDAYAWSKFARVVTSTNNIDFRSRAHSTEELQFLGHRVAGSGLEVTFAQLEKAPRVLLVGFEPEEEAGSVFLRLRKGVLAKKVHVTAIAPFASRGLTKVRGDLIVAAPGTEAAVINSLAADHGELLQELSQPGAVIIAGERAGLSPGTLSALQVLADQTGARLAWIPRRAGDRGAIEAGLLPTLLPGGRPVADAEARIDTASAWGVESLPAQIGLDASGIIEAADRGDLAAVVTGGIDVVDFPEPTRLEAALGAAGFVLTLEVRRSAVTRFADVVLPVAPTSHKGGTFLNWEGRPRPFGQVFATTKRSDAQVLHMLAEQFGVDLGTRTLEQAHREFAEFGGWDGQRVAAPTEVAPAPATSETAGYVLASWRMMLDAASGQDGETYLAGTAHRPVVRISHGAATALGVSLGDRVAVTTQSGTITLPVLPTTMPDGVVWVPLNSPGSQVYRTLGVTAGDYVTVHAEVDQ